MKRLIIIMQIFASFLAYAQNPQHYVAKTVEAIGGVDALIKYQDYRGEGEVKLLMYRNEIPGQFQIIKKGAKSWAKYELIFGKEKYVMINGFDGEAAFSDQWGTVVDKPSLNYLADLDHDIPLLQNKQVAFSTSRETELKGKKVIGIGAELDDKKTFFYLDKENFFIQEMVFKDIYFNENNTKEMIEKRVQFEDYHQIDMVWFPMKIIYYSQGKKDKELIFTKVSFNPNVFDKIFTRPPQKLDLRYWDETMN